MTSSSCNLETRIVGYIQSLKEMKTHKAIAERKKLVNVLMSNSTESISSLSKKLKQRWHFVAAASTLPEEAEELALTVHRNSQPSDSVHAVEDFFLRPECSIVIPDRKMVKKDLVPQAVLAKSLKALHDDFVQETGTPISLAAMCSPWTISNAQAACVKPAQMLHKSLRHFSHYCALPKSS